MEGEGNNDDDDDDRTEGLNTELFLTLRKKDTTASGQFIKSPLMLKLVARV